MVTRSPLESLFAPERRRVLTYFFTQPNRWSSVSRVATELELPEPRVTAEVWQLVEGGLLRTRRQDEAPEFRPDTRCVFFRELRALFRKSSHWRRLLRDALLDTRLPIEMAFVHGRAAENLEQLVGPAEVMVVGEVRRRAVSGLLVRIGTELGQTLRVRTLRRRELALRAARQDPLISRVLQAPRLWLIGNEQWLDLVGLRLDDR